MRMVDIIEKKRDGYALSREEITFFINEYTSESIPDYQASALLMAIFFKGMNIEETTNLTKAMVKSGNTIDLTSIKNIKVDKHSTGGVGDKTTLVVAPIVASLGVPVAKMSGKGLGHTGGTIDKLNSIPGFKTSLSMEEFLLNVNEIGISIAGQTGNLAPADKKLYALRDVTATVNQTSLIAASIMSKKLAAGSDAIVLDVKVGNGAFMKTLDDARNLARIMVDIGKGVGKRTVAVLTDMNKPLGHAIGNAIEVVEAIEVLKGNGPKDLMEVCYTLATQMLVLADKGSENECIDLVEDSIKSGRALNKFTQLVKQQGGNPDIINNYSLLPKAIHTEEYHSCESGYISEIESNRLGILSMILGAGRASKEDKIDYGAGIKLIKNIGDKVKKGETICVLHSNDKAKIDNVINNISNVFKISSQAPEEQPLVLDKIY